MDGYIGSLYFRFKGLKFKGTSCKGLRFKGTSCKGPRFKGIFKSHTV